MRLNTTRFKTRLRRLVGFALIVAITVGFSSLTSAGVPVSFAQDPPPAPAQQRGKSQRTPSESNGRAYTAQEMSAAKPKDLTDNLKQMLGKAPPKQASTPAGPPGSKPGLLPGGQRGDFTALAPVLGFRPSRSIDPIKDEPTTIEPKHGPIGVAAPPHGWSRWEWFGRYRKYPVSTQGKLFFTQYGSTFVCSASTIDYRHIATAGHCLHAGDGSPNGWSYNIWFYPSYDSSQGGVNPAVGGWAIEYASTDVSDEWYSNGSAGHFDRDWGWGRSAPTGTIHATNLGNITGALGYAWNYTDEHFIIMGYPQAPPFSGGKLQTCAAEHRYNRDLGTGSDSVAVACDLTGGSSGGGWLIGFGPNGAYLNGVMSYGFFAEESGSPDFSSEAGGWKLTYEAWRTAWP